MNKTNSIKLGATVRLPDNTTGLVTRVWATEVEVAQPVYRGSRRNRRDIWHRSQVTAA